MLIKNQRALLSILVIITLLISACSGGRTRAYQSRNKYKNWNISKAKGVKPSNTIKFEMNDRVAAWLDYFQGPGRERFGRYLKRSGRYIPTMQKILSEHGIPPEVVYIAMIESGFSSGAYSRAAAVGFWQFIRGTGARYGLRMDQYVDERMDPVKSTHAAAGYLTDLYEEFGDWFLAFAGYNSGEGKVRGAISKYGFVNFWEMTSRGKDHFRPETKDYVPKYIAAAILATNPKKYGFNVEYDKPIEYDLVKIDSQTDLETVAKCAKADYAEVTALNTELVMGITPPGGTYSLRVPKGKGTSFLVAFEKLPKEERLARRYDLTPSYHVVRKGDTLDSIAKRYGITEKAILAANRIKGKSHLKRGLKLVIPIKEMGGASDRLVASKNLPSSAVKYRVKSGDTVSSIANKYGVRNEDIKNWNKLRSNKLTIGMKLKIYSGGPSAIETVAVSSSTEASSSSTSATKVGSKMIAETYKVKRGDSLQAIAKNNGVSIEQLKKWNNMEDNKLRAGDVLVVNQKELVGKSGGKLVKGEIEAPKVDKKIAVSSTSSRDVELEGIIQSTKEAEADISLPNNEQESAAPEMSKENAPLMSDMSEPAPAPALKKAPVIVLDEKPAVVSSSKPAPQTSGYTVKAGDTLYGIARKNNISLADLAELNGLNRSAVLKPGVTLKVSKAVAAKKNNVEASSPVKTPSVSQSEKNAASDRLDLKNTPATQNKTKTTNYKIKKGDTVWDIAKRNNLSVNDIKSLNSGKSLDKLKPGDTIKLK